MTAPRNAIPGADDIRRTRLDNGIQVFTRPNPASPAVVIGGFLHAGSAYDPPERLGLAAFTASALMRGTQQRTFQQIYAQLEDVGASLGFSAGVHTVSFNGRALAEDLPLLLGLLTEALRQPAFPPEEVARLKTQILTGLSLRARDTESMAALAFDELIYGPSHPYGRPNTGFPETVQPIQAADLAAFHARHYGPRGMSIVLVGAVEHEAIVARLNDYLGDWDNPGQPPAAEVTRVPPPDRPRSRHIYIPDKEQVDLVIGSTAPPRQDPDFTPAMLGNAILGQFGMMGRIGEVVRERAGLAYYAYSNLSASLSTGTWDVSAGVNPDNLPQALALIREELRRFVEAGVTQEELEDIRQGMKNRLPLSLEANAGVLTALLNIARYDLDLDYYRRFDARLDAVTPEDVHRVAQRYIRPEALVCASAGTLEGEPCD